MVSKTRPSSDEGESRERNEFIQTRLEDLFRLWLVRACLIGSILFLLLAGLDYLVAREHFQVFFLYRIAAALVLLTVGLSGRHVRSGAVQTGLGFLIVAASAAVIELMILRFGGHTSMYYPGMILLGVVVFGIFPAGLAFHLVSAGIIYGSYLLPILIFDEITNPSFFLTANVFTIGIFSTSIYIRHLFYLNLRDQLGLQYDLVRHKQSLEKDVSERTMQLTKAVSSLRREVAVREQSEEELLGVLGEWKATFDSAREMILLLDPDLKIRKLNRAAADFLGIGFRDGVGQAFIELLGKTEPSGEAHPLARSIRSGRHEEAEVFLPEKDMWLLASVNPVFSDRGELTGVVHFLHDITYVHKIQSQVRRAKLEWEDTFDVINDAITIHDDTFRIVRANRAACELLGTTMEGILTHRCFESYHGTEAPPDACPSCSVLVDGVPCTSEIFEPHLGKHLEVKALPKFDGDGRVSGLVHIVRDISLRKEAEEQQGQLQAQLQQAQKMESIGRLAGGVAHDFNNILFAMLGYAELATGKIPADHPAQKSLRVIMESGQRAATLNRQLLAFSRKQVLNLKHVRPGDIIENMGTMLERLIGEEISFCIDAKGQQSTISADTGQIEQVVMNLVINARDALSQGSNITLRALDVSQGEEKQFTSGVAGPGRYVELSVADNGCGMPAEIQEKVFEPFFTTKKAGEGSGLGLSTVYGIVQQHHGHIDIESREGEGTTVRVLLPATEFRSDQPEPKVVEDTGRGRETVLVVEDELNVRNLVRDVLEPLGYRLLLAENGEKALSLLDEQAGEIHLLLTDVVMPVMNGVEFAAHFRRRHPGAPVIFMSGYTDDIISRHGVVDNEETLLEKPVKPGDLAQAVRQMLDGRHPFSP